jgi:hypothetical protein
MAMTDLKVIEKSIAHAFALKEKGVTEPTILAVFPDEKKYIQAAFSFVGALRMKKDELSGNEEIFRLTLNTLDSSEMRSMPHAEKKAAFGFLKSSKISEPVRPVVKKKRRPIKIPWEKFKFYGVGVLILIALIVAGYAYFFQTNKPLSAEEVLLAYTEESRAKQNSTASTTDTSFITEDIAAASAITEAASGVSTDSMCSDFTSFSQNINDVVVDAKSAYRTVIADRHATVSSYIEVFPVDAPSLNVMRNALRAKATSEEDQKAVLKFEGAVSTAETARSLALKNALETFALNADEIFLEREAELEIAIREFQTGVQLSLGNAEEACAVETERFARNQFESQLEASVRTLESRINELEGDSALKVLANDLQTTIDSENENFDLALAQALETLKQEFPKGVE